MTKNEILNYLKNHQKEFQESYGIESFGLYGSYARGENTHTSDIDIFFKSDVNFSLGLFEYSKLIDKLENDLKSKIDLVDLEYMNPIVKYYAKKDFIYV